MKTKFFLSVMALGLFVSAFSQKATMELTFTAENNGQYVPLDSILIENQTQGGDTTLYAPDTILVLDYVTSIGDKETVEKNTFSVSQNYPNHFEGRTSVNLYLPEKENIKISIRDILGRELAQYKKALNRGNHSFSFYSGNEKYYLFTVTGKQTSRTIKMLNANSNTTYGGKCKIVYEVYENNVIGFKSQKAVNDFIFILGDQLRFTGYAMTADEVLGSDEVEDIPEDDKTYEFDIISGIRCPGTPKVSYEGMVYNTVLIGYQCWLKESLNVGIMINGNEEMTDNGTIEKYCYNNNPSYCSAYGGLYQWNEMMQYTTAQGAQGICPPDWHLPTDEEWKQLEGAVDSQYGYPDPEWDIIGYRGFDAALNLKSTNYWDSGGNGTDMFGFTARPGGWKPSYGDFSDEGYLCNFWSSTENYTNNVWRRGLSAVHDAVARGSDDGGTGFSSRCLKD